MLAPATDALLDRLVAAPADVRAEVLEQLAPRDAQVVEGWLRHSWRMWARDKQMPPAGSWRYCVMCAGRSWGKTLAAAQEVRRRAEAGTDQWISVVGPTMATVLRDMVMGPSGLLAVCPPWFKPGYQPSLGAVIFPPHPLTGTRTRVALLSADRPERIRGSQCSFLWADEPQSWTHAEAALDQLDLTLRLGDRPQALVTLTPRPNEVTRRLLMGPPGDDGQRRLPATTVVVRGSTFENVALSADVLAELKARFEGTRLGQQELYAEVLERPERALFTEECINNFRVPGVPCTVEKLVVAVDPARSRWATGDMAGGCVTALGEDGHVYVLEDCSLRGTPLEWIRHFAGVFNFYRADLGVFEQNRLDEQLVEMLRREWRGQTWEPRTASEKKAQRLEPVAAAAQAGRVHFVGSLPELEEQLLSFDPSEPRGQQDDRVDAFAWAVRELLQGSGRAPLILR